MRFLMAFSAILSLIFTPVVVSFIVKRKARKQAVRTGQVVGVNA